MRTAVTRSPIPATTSSLAPKREGLRNSERPRPFNGRTSPGVCGLFFDGGGSDIRISGKVRFTRSRNLSPKNEETRVLSKFAIHYPVVPIPFPPLTLLPHPPKRKRRNSKAAHAALRHPGTVRKNIAAFEEEDARSGTREGSVASEIEGFRRLPEPFFCGSSSPGNSKGARIGGRSVSGAGWER
ncbi:MAG: hypothetical protein RLZZ142_2493 [Verrucomicrobiota bacterium]